MPASAALRRIAADDPSRVLLEVGDDSFTYAEIDAQVDALAQQLLTDLGPHHHRVGVRLSGSHAMMIGCLAVQRAGMTTVALDPAAPQEYVESVLAQVQPALLLSDADLGRPDGIRTENPLAYAATPPPGGVVTTAAPLAAIAYTSGSTGAPKGIMLPTAHRVGMAERTARLALLAGGEPHRFAALTAGTVGIADVLMHSIVTTGATFVSYEIRRQGIAPLGDWIADHGITAFPIVPTILRFLMPTLSADLEWPDLRLVVLGGEASTWEDVQQLRRHISAACIIANQLGQTEVGISEFVVPPEPPAAATGALPAGTVLPGRELAIVSPDGKLCGPGEAGEIVITTRDCGIGYWAQPDAARGVFEALGDGRWQVRTGDVGRRDSDGLLQHLGRLDNVVKIYGNRVDLNDVEHALRNLPMVTKAAVRTFTTDAGELRLAGYVCLEVGTQTAAIDLRRLLARRLPGPRVPDVVIPLDDLPILPSGKIDRLALPLPAECSSVGESGDQPSSAMEQTLMGMFREVLNTAELSVHDSFFDRGGDSLRAARLIAKLERELDISRPVSLLIEAPTVRALAVALSDPLDPWEALVPLRVEGDLPPLYVVHDGYGDVFYAERLLRYLGPQQPVYGLQPRALNGYAPAMNSIEETAAQYVEEIQRQRPCGPYLLYGYSLGGVIGFEMARQLTASGETVSFLGLGDTHAPLDRGLPVHESWTQRARHRRQEVAQLPPRRAVSEVLRLAARQVRHLTVLTAGTASSRVLPAQRAHRARLRRLDSSRLTGARVIPEDRADFVVRTYGPMTTRYRPSSPYAGRVLLIRAERDDDRRSNLWSTFIDGEIDVIHIDCTHPDLHREPVVRLVAEAIRREIDRSLARSSSTVP